MTKISKKVKIINVRGLHARATAEFVKLADTFTCDIWVSNSENLKVSGKSIMGLLMLGAPMGMTLLIEAEGSDAELALDSLEKLIINKFGEEA